MKKLEYYKIMPIFPEEPVSDPQISPDGKKVLFTYTTVNMIENKYNSHIWIQNLEEEEQPKQFTYGKCNDTNPRWSPDGKSILFLSDRINEENSDGKKTQIWLIPTEGGEARCITNVEDGVKRPFWSSVGNEIYFSSNIFRGEKKEDSDVKIIRNIKYKQDVRGFFEGRRTHLFSVTICDRKIKRLTDGDFDVEKACLSPDGKKIAFISNLDENADLSDFKNIYLISSDGGKPKLIWKGQGPILALNWSPDGNFLAFTGWIIDNPKRVIYKKTNLWLFPINGKEPKNITPNFDRTLRLVRELKWSTDSKYVYFSKVKDNGSSHIFRASLEGKIEKVTEGNMTVFDFSIWKNRKLIFNATNNLTLTELYTKDTKGIRQLTEMNRQLLKQLTLNEPEEFWFKASDDVKIQGWIIKPCLFKSDKKYPTIIQIHGGPWSDYGYRLTPAEHEFQVLAEHGFVVVYTNPRGSIGYGEAFTSRISGEWGGRDYKDIMEAVDYVVKKYPFIDAERLGVAGGSYGGFMTNWIVGHTDRFKAAVSMRSISNWYSFVGTSHVGWLHVFIDEILLGKDPWDNLQVVMERSPISYIKNVRTPLLLIQSEKDYSCPMEQAEQFFTGLKKLKKTAEFVRFPDEGHELSRSGKPKHRVERLQHIVRWFDRYLKEI